MRQRPWRFSRPVESQLSLTRLVSAIECELEQLEGRLAYGKVVDLDIFARVAGHLRRLLEAFGLERRARPVETLEAYIAERYGSDRPREATDALEDGSGSEAAGGDRPASRLPRPSEEASP